MLEAIEISEFATPYIAILIGLVVSLWAKDFANNLAVGLTFKLNRLFNEGDSVIIDNETAIIVKIGIRTTIFSITKEDGKHIWRSVPNSRIPYLKLEKIIKP